MLLSFIHGKAWEWTHRKVAVASESTQAAVLHSIITEVADAYKCLSKVYLFFIFNTEI